MIIDKANKFNLLSTAETGAATAKPNKPLEIKLPKRNFDVVSPFGRMIPLLVI